MNKRMTYFYYIKLINFKFRKLIFENLEDRVEADRPLQRMLTDKRS